MRSGGKILAVLLALSAAGCGLGSTGRADKELSADGISAPAPKNLGVNAYLWRAALETLSFLRLAATDPFGGVIISDWYAPAAGTGERLKVVVHIMDRELRPDGLKVSVFRQERIGEEWRYAGANPAMVRQLEDAILTRARELSLRDRGGNLQSG